MKGDINFLHFKFRVGDEEPPEYYLLIIEICNGVPVLTLIAKYPKTPVIMHLYPYSLN